MALPSVTVEAAVARYEKPLLRYARKWVKDPELARDVVQDTFIRFYESGEDGPEARTKAWLYTVCRNRAIDLRRRAQRAPKIDPSSAPWVEPLGERQCDLGQVCKELDALPERKSEVLRLRYHEGLSYRGISEATGLTVGNVGFTISTTLKRIRTRLAIGAAVVVVLCIAGASYALLRPAGPTATRAGATPRGIAPILGTAPEPTPIEDAPQKEATGPSPSTNPAPSAAPQKRPTPPDQRPPTRVFRPMGL